MVVNARPFGHQIEAKRIDFGPAAMLQAVSEFSGASVEWSITGKIAARKR